MSSVHRLAPDDLEALRTGRAIPFLINHRVAELPGYTLTVIARRDDEKFRLVLLSDDLPDEKLVNIDIPEPFVVIDDGILLASADAAVVHRLWQRWDGGVRDCCLHFVQQIAIALGIDARNTILSIHGAATSPDTEKAAPPSDAPPRPRRQTKGKKKTSSRKGGGRS